jgi:Neuraminidase (sialidase)
VVKTTRVVSLSGLKTLSFPLTELFYELALKVYDRINQTWQTSPTFTQNLVYRVSASQDGAIGNFEPLNQPAKDYTQETPLPNLLKSSQTGS